jgi:hypothetical protein
LGQIHLLDEIIILARRQYPYEQPDRDFVLRDDVDEGARINARLKKQRRKP